MLCQRYHFGWDPHAETDKVNNKLCALVVLSCTSGLLQAEFYHAVDDRGQTVRLVRPQRALSAGEGWLEAANNSALGRQVADVIQLSISGLFLIDACIRIVAMGFVVDAQAYLRRPKYMTEFALLAILIPVDIWCWGGGEPWTHSEGVPLEQVSMALPFRCLIWLRMCTHFKPLTLLIRTVSDSIPQLSLMLIMMVLIIMAASVMGVQLWHGLFGNKCFAADPFVANLTEDDGIFDIRPPFVTFGQRTSLCMPAPTGDSAQVGRACSNLPLAEGGAAADRLDVCVEDCAVANSTCEEECHRLFEMNQRWGDLECRASDTNLFPHEKLLSFDNIAEAMFLVFQLITLSSWSQVMYAVADIDDIMTVPFFVLVVMFGAYFIQNLTVAILKAKFDSASDRILEELKLEEKVTQHELEYAKKNRGKQLIAKLRGRVKVLSALGILEKAMQERQRRGVNRPDANPIAAIRWKQARAKVATVNALYGSAAEARRKQLEKQAATAVEVATFTLGKRNNKQTDATLQDLVFGRVHDDEEQDSQSEMPSPKSPRLADRAWAGTVGISRRCQAITNHRSFEKFFVALTLFNTLILAMEFHEQPTAYSLFIEKANMVCALTFAAEMAIRLTAETPLGYIKSAFNVFDAFIVITSILDLFILEAQAGTSSIRTLRVFRMFRVFRVLRIIKLIRYLDNLKNIIMVVLRCIPHVTWVSLLLLSSLCMWATAAEYLFRGKFDFPHGRPRANFDTFTLSFVSMFQVLTLDDWEFIMYDAVQATGTLWTCVFFVSWILLGVYILLNVLTILILSRFLKAADEEEVRLRPARSHRPVNSCLLPLRRAHAHSWATREPSRISKRSRTPACVIGKSCVCSVALAAVL